MIPVMPERRLLDCPTAPLPHSPTHSVAPARLELRLGCIERHTRGRPAEVAVNSLLHVRNGRPQNPCLRMFVWNEAQIPQLYRQLEESMLRMDPRKEAACGRSAGPVTEPEAETNLSNPQDLWVALANESRVRSRLSAAAAIGRRQFAR
jgi:hypothetical protein